MLNISGMIDSSLCRKFSSKSVKIFDIQTLCFWLIKDPTSIPVRFIHNGKHDILFVEVSAMRQRQTQVATIA